MNRTIIIKESYDIYERWFHTTITATEFKKNLGKYMQLALDEDVYITKNGTILVKMSNPNKDKVDILNSLVGIAADNNMTMDEIKAARLERQ